jgi:stage II sporulation protein E
LLNKARIDSQAFGQYEPLASRLPRAAWRNRYQALLASLTDGATLRLLAISLLLGRAVVFGELAPFGLAFFLTVRWYRPEWSWQAAAALGLGAYLRAPGAAVSLLGSMGIFISLERFLLGSKLRNATTSTLLASFSCLLVKFPLFILQAPSLFDLTNTVLEAGLVAVLAYVLRQTGRILLGAEARELNSEQALALCVTGAAMLTGLEGWAVFGLSLRAIAAAYMVMVGAYVGGPGLGCAAGAAIGVVLNLAHPGMLGQVGLYAFAGLLAGLFRDMKKLGVGLSLTMALLLLTVYGSEPGDLGTTAAQAAVAFVLFLVTGKRWQTWLTPHVTAGGFTLATEMQNDRQTARMQQVITNRLQDLEAVFLQLSETFAEQSDDEGFLVEKNFNALMDHIVTDVCEGCQHFGSCWQKDFYKSYQTLLNMLALADAHGELSLDRIPESLRQRCHKPEALVTCANYLVKVYKLNLYWQRKLGESRGLVASQLKGVAGIMHSLGREMRMDVEFEQDLAEEIKQEISKLKLFVPQVEVYRRRDRVDVTINKPACQGGESHCVDQLIPLVSSLVGRPVTRMHSKCPRQSGKAKCALCLSTSQPLQADTGVAQVCRTGAGVSGDTISVRELPSGKLAVLLSDGMGNGPEANRESRATVAVLEQLLRSGFDQETAVQTINSVLMLRSSKETFATVDMAMLDLYTGVAELTKIGATAAFLKRGDHIECVRSSSLPAGILHKIEVESFRVPLQPGDILVMITDGLLDSQKDITDKEEWFTRILRQCNQENPEALAKYLLERANMNARGQVLDDMSVVAVRITQGAASIPLVS